MYQFPIILNFYATDLIPAGIDLPVTQYAGDDKDWTGVISASSYLPRLHLFGGNSDAVKEGKIGVGRYGLVRNKDQIDDLTAVVDVLPLSWRYKAMSMKEEQIVSFYDPKSAGFKDLQARAEIPNSSCTYGVEFLLWIPSLHLFATYYLNSKTARREAPNLRDILVSKRAASLKVQLITKGKFKWHGPVVTVCSTPIDLPDPVEMMDQATRFANPKESAVEPVAAVTSDARPQ